MSFASVAHAPFVRLLPAWRFALFFISLAVPHLLTSLHASIHYSSFLSAAAAGEPNSSWSLDDLLYGLARWGVGTSPSSWQNLLLRFEKAKAVVAEWEEGLDDAGRARAMTMDIAEKSVEAHEVKRVSKIKKKKKKKKKRILNIG